MTMTPGQARDYIRAVSDIEGWSERETLEALDDVRDGMDVSNSWHIHKGALAYGIVISENHEADTKVCGFVEFGDVILWHRKRGQDCRAIRKLSRENSEGMEGYVTNGDGTRMIEFVRGDDPVILNDWRCDVVGVVWKWHEMQNK